jgi:hypothetical protein
MIPRVQNFNAGHVYQGVPGRPERNYVREPQTILQSCRYSSALLAIDGQRGRAILAIRPPRFCGKAASGRVARLAPVTGWVSEANRACDARLTAIY